MHSSTLRRRLIGDRAFYAKVIAIVVPMIIQSTITNVVSLLDNVMVGQVGTLQMSAVAIVNQLQFIFNLSIFGGLAGAGIFATQYAGARDDDGVRYCFRIKLIIAAVMFAIALGVFIAVPSQLISLYLAADTAPDIAASTMRYGLDYMNVMLWGMLPFAMSQIYASTLREVGETRLPMIASIVAIFVNLIFNYLLIFGTFGFPEMGVTGAAIATVLSRYIEAAIIIAYTHLRRSFFGFIQGAYRSLHVPLDLCFRVFRKGSPLLVNEFLWSFGMALLMQCYSVRGLNVVAAMNISSTVSNLFNVVFMNMGNAVGIMVGQALGADDPRYAKDTAYKLITAALASCVVMGTAMLLLAPLVPNIYNTEADVRDLACQFLRIVALMMPLYSIVHCCYFTLRSGGRTGITFLFDSGYTWVLSIPAAFILARHFGQASQRAVGHSSPPICTTSSGNSRHTSSRTRSK